MATYYRKHEQINGFQFDGTLTQLQHELPNQIFVEFLKADNWGNTFTFKRNDQNYIQQINNDRYGLPWVMDKRKRRHRRNHKFKRINWTDYQMIGQQAWMNRMKPAKPTQNRPFEELTGSDYLYKYTYAYKLLHRGDYIIPGYRTRITNHHMRWVPYLKIIRAKQFEATWSKTPIN